MVSADLNASQIITTGEVLTEMLNYYAERGVNQRVAATHLVRSILVDVKIEIISSTAESFLDGLTFYESRRDKGYSLTDCISMNVCRTRGILNVLTHDHHFEQEGFHTLL